jgi:hypothetical protein
MLTRFSLCIVIFCVLFVQAQQHQMSPEEVAAWYQGMSSYFNAPAYAEAPQGIAQYLDGRNEDSSDAGFPAPSSYRNHKMEAAMMPHVAAVAPAGDLAISARAASPYTEKGYSDLTKTADAEPLNAPVQAVNAQSSNAAVVNTDIGPNIPVQPVNIPAQAANVPAVEHASAPIHAAAIDSVIESAYAKPIPAADALVVSATNTGSARIAANIKPAVAPVIQPDAAVEVAPETSVVGPASAADKSSDVTSVVVDTDKVSKAAIQDIAQSKIVAAPIVPVTTIQLSSSATTTSPLTITATTSVVPTTTSAIITTRTTTSQTTSPSLTRSAIPSATTTVPPISFATRSEASISSLFVVLITMVLVYL